LVPIDGSEYSLNAAQYATRIARNEKAQLFCIHIVTPRIPFAADMQLQRHLLKKVNFWAHIWAH